MIEVPSVELVPVSSLKIDLKNPNKMSAAKFEALKKNLQRFGFIVPIITNKDLLVADGQHRFEAAKALGMITVPVIKLNVSEVDRRILRQVLNKLKGEHSLDLDSDEYNFILEQNADQDFKNLLALDDFEFNSIVKFNSDFYAEKVLDGVIKTNHKCPKCGYEYD